MSSLRAFRDPVGGAYAVCGVADSRRPPASMALFVEEDEAFDAVAGAISAGATLVFLLWFEPPASAETSCTG